MARGGLGGGFPARLESGKIRFWLNDDYYEPYPDVVEALGPDQCLIINIGGLLLRSGLDFAGTLSGQIFLSNSPSPWRGPGKILSWCTALNHRFVLRRQ